VPDAARYIERLALTAPAEAGLVRGRLLVEDAFRIASFPGEAERRVLAIRRVDLGIVDPERSAAALAPVIEEAVRAAAGRAVRFDDPTAAAANAVYFPDELAAATAFVERVAGAPSPMEWFWNSVFEGGVPPGDAEAGGRLALNCLLEFPGGPARVAMLVDVLRARGTADRLLAWLRPTDGVRLLNAFGLDAAPDRRRVALMERVEVVEAAQTKAEAQGDAPPFTVSALRAWQPVLTAWIARWGEHDPRARWLAAAALVSNQPSILAHPGLRILALRVLRAARPSPVVTRGPSRRSTRAERAATRALRTGRARPLDTERVGAAPEHSAPRARAQPGASPSPGAQPVDRLPGARAAGASTVAEAPDAAEVGAPQVPDPATAPWNFELHPTAAAGLLFAVPLLSRLGVEDLLATNSVLVEMEFPLRLLLLIADRVHVSEEDAVRVPLLPAGPGPPPGDWDRVLASWLARVRRALHRQARMGLRALVVRSGQIASTRTHIDIVLPLRELDIRVRRSGLDADPGWVPWLGQVVTFHYEAEP